MRYSVLGNTGLVVSRLCFGTLTIGPLQRGLPVRQGARLMRYAYEQGVNFYDTAEYYANYAYIREAFKDVKDVVIATKSYAYDEKGARESLERYLRETGRERAEIFMLHEQESEHTLRGHWDALLYYVKKMEQGLIGAVGLSTHRVAGVRAAIRCPQIQVVHPLLNVAGKGIGDGTRDEMQAAVQEAYARQKGVYAMKALGGGTLIQERERALDYITGLPCLHAVAVGMQHRDEVLYNARYFDGKRPGEALSKRLNGIKRNIIIEEESCTGCGACAARCAQQAIAIKDGKARVDPERCVCCGYCCKVCEAFAIRVV